ncbi:unnamed protein product, partial [Polarella glacialis]
LRRLALGNRQLPVSGGMQPLWEPLRCSEQPGGFPREPVALATVRLRGGEELLTAVGGAASSAPRRQGGGEEGPRKALADCDFEEFLFDGAGEAPTDLWARPCTQHPGSDVAPFRRSVLAFPPRPRCSFSLTALDGRGQRLLLFGGRATGKGLGRCLADLHVLEMEPATTPATVSSSSSAQPFPTAATEGSPKTILGLWLTCKGDPRGLSDKQRTRTPSESSRSDSEAEEGIFCASNYRAACASSCAAASVAARKQPSVAASASAAFARKRRAGGVCESSSEDELEQSSDPPSPSRPTTSAGPAMPRTLKDVMSSLGANMPVTMTRREVPVTPERNSPPALEGRHGHDSSAVADGARWRQPQMLDSGSAPRPRAGHSAVLQAPASDGETPVVLIYGGLGDGGLPLGDTFEVRVLETADQALESVWTLLDSGGSEHCETAPWELQERPRPRACHSAVFWASGSQRRSMIVFGGLGMGLAGEPRAYGDTWTFMVGNSNTAAGRSTASGASCGWKRPMMQGGAPARRFGHGACLVGGSTGGSSTMLVCGGTDASGRALADCWVLNLEDMRWEAIEEASPTSQLPLCRSLTVPGMSALQTSVPASSAQDVPHELGRCVIAWSTTDNAAVVWSCQGFWRWNEPEQQRWQRMEKRKALSVEEEEEGAEPGRGRARKEARAPRKRRGSREEDEAVARGGGASSLVVSGDLEVTAVEEWRRPTLGDTSLAPIGLGTSWKQLEAAVPAAKRPPVELPGVLPPQRRRPPPGPGMVPIAYDARLEQSPMPWNPVLSRGQKDPFSQSWPPQALNSRSSSLRTRGPPSAPSSDCRPSASRMDLGPVIPPCCVTPLRAEPRLEPLQHGMQAAAKDGYRPVTPRRKLQALSGWSS